MSHSDAETRLPSDPGAVTAHQRDDHPHITLDLLERQNEVLALVVRGAPLSDTLEVLLRAIEAPADGMLCSILLLDKDGIHVRHGAAPSLPESYIRAIDGERIGPIAGSCGTAAYRREPVIVEDIATDPLWAPYREVALAHGLRACWSTPMLDGPSRRSFARRTPNPCAPRTAPAPPGARCGAPCMWNGTPPTST
jgi:GAF domain